MKQDFSGRYFEFESLLNQLSVFYTILSLSETGVNLGKSYSTKDELKISCKIALKYEKFFDYILNVLESYGVFLNEGGNWRFTINDNIKAKIDTLNLQLESEFPEYIDIVKFVRHCIKHHPRVLKGEISGVTLVYPGGDTSFLNPIILAIEKLYRINYQVRVLTSVLQCMSREKKLAILEVGGGLGRVTWKVLPKTNLNNISYHFTDISRFFMVKAKELAREQDINYMTFGQFDISKDPLAQGLQLESFDFILALNVIHATPDVMQTFNNLKKLLRPDGKLFIIEHVTLPVWASLSWGVLEGWWSFNDSFRKKLPTLEREEWELILKKSGFQNIRSFPKKNTRFDSILSYLGLLASI